MICSLVADGNLHVFQVTAAGDLVHRSHARRHWELPQ